MAETMYGIFRFLARPVVGLLWPAQVEGLENVPETGGCLLCANHLSNRDPVFLAVNVGSRHIHFMAKVELFKCCLFGALLRGLLAFPVDRGHNDLNAIRTANKILADGHALGLFPQGTRSHENARLPMLNGVSMLALRARKPVIPVYIGGPYHLFRPTPLRFGKPVDFSDFGPKMDGETLAAATRRIEDAVWAMAREDDR